MLFVRRSQQLVHPQVWDEEFILLHQLIGQGVLSLLTPINGFLCTLPRIITLASLSISFTQYPLVSTILSWTFFVASMVAVAMSPTILRGGALLAIAVLMVPSDPEVIGIPLYTFWFAGLLVFIAGLWKPNAAGYPLRALFIAVGGLSSPSVILAAPIFLVRAGLFRKPAELALTAFAVACAVLQVFLLQRFPLEIANGGAVNLAHADLVLPKFLGSYVAGNLASGNPSLLMTAGIASLGFLAYAVWLDRRNPALLALCFLWAGSIFIVGARIDLATIDPAAGGPRYFFLPFVFEGWLLIQLAVSGKTEPIRYIAIAMLVGALANCMPVLTRGHVDLHWSDHAAACARVPGAVPYNIPIEFDGKGILNWNLTLTGDQCREAARRALFH